MEIKICTWNLEHARKLLSPDPTSNTVIRRRRVRETIESINPNILCIQEGPPKEEGITDFCNQVLNDQWAPVLLRQEGEDLGERDSEYQLKGTQWIWFLVKSDLLGKCRLQSPAVWQAFTDRKTWKVNYWGEERSGRHVHYRHPQVLIFDIGDGQEIEFIGVHLKSKINTKKVIWIDEELGDLDVKYVITATKNRIKLATEARNIRKYISAKFSQIQHPGIVILGDCNDGPGHDYFEENYHFFDLITNLQGEVLVADRFFDHALSHFPDPLRWTAKYRDKVTKKSAKNNPLLLDHILISKPIAQGQLSVAFSEEAGLVEHEAFERANAGANKKTRSSDHRPASATLRTN